MICKKCGTAQGGENVLPGSGWIEFVLYFAYLFPGIIYSIWRRSNRHPTCAACGGRELVGAQTPVGQKLAREHYPDGITAGPAAVAKTPSVIDRVAHRITVGLLWFLGLLVAVAFGGVMLASWLR